MCCELASMEGASNYMNTKPSIEQVKHCDIDLRMAYLTTANAFCCSEMRQNST